MLRVRRAVDGSGGAGRGPDASERVTRAMAVASANPIAVGIIERRRALLAGDGGALDALDALTDRLAAAGCPYQERRTRSLG